MPTSESSDSGAKPGSLTKPARDLLLAGVNEIQAKFREVARAAPPDSFKVRSQLNKQQNELLQQYYAQLPRYVFGRCPFCNILLEQIFDPWGLDGFWWQETLTGRCPKPSACEHFRVLTGALNLNERPPLGGEAESHPGPEVPYVIPVVLDMPTMLVVISSLAMVNGYTAYPISYFSQDKPPTPALANPWRLTSCSFITANGKSGFTYKTDPWDFELLPWVMKGKVKWIAPGDSQNVLKSAPAEKCPYLNLQGLRLRQVIKKDQRHTQPPPNKEVYNPFAE